MTTLKGLHLPNGNRQLTGQAPTPMPRVSLFIGCLNDVYYPRVGVAVTKILEHFGCRVEFLDSQTCCGAGLFEDGYVSDAKEVARRFVGIFRDSDYVLTPSPRCCAMVREQYTRLLVDDEKWEASMWQVAGRTYEFVEFLQNVLKARLPELTMPRLASVTYLPACQLRNMGVGDESPNILRRMRNIELKTLPDAERCCGAGGGLARRQPELAQDLRDQKLQMLRGTGAAFGVCNEALCAMRLANRSLPIKHIAEVIAEAMGIDCENF
jgi:L-lactate dehydrogenase complex protein LldE